MPVSAPETPKISCLMVTANRPHLMKRSVACYLNQSYPNKELVVVDDGAVDCSDVLADVPSDELIYRRLPSENRLCLGALRNLTLDLCTGSYMAQWDDDDWYDEDRLAIQYNDLVKTGKAVSCLSSTLVCIDDPMLDGKPFIGGIAGGVPGSILHERNDSIRYPDKRRAEDSEYLRDWPEGSVSLLDRRYAYLMIRVYHGNNTWSIDHFKRRIRNSPLRLLKYVYWTYIRRNMFGLQCFSLTDDMDRAYRTYARDSLTTAA